MYALPLKLIDQYARPMTNKITIKNAIDYFHMEAPSATVSMKLNPDLQTTLMVDGLCRISGTHLGKGLEDAKVGHCMCVRVQRSESNIHRQPRSTSELSTSTGDWLFRDYRIHPLAG